MSSNSEQSAIHERSRLRVPVSIYQTSAAASAAVAHEIAAQIRSCAAQGRRCVLGLATGSTPSGVYEELVRLHRDEALSFRNVVTFNLDEYWPMDPAALQSYRRFMDEHLLDHIDIDRANVHLPDGTVSAAGVNAHCQAYERAIAAAGGVDLQLLGIGRTGHIGFNEPGSPRTSRTRTVTLDRVTRLDAAGDFFGEPNVPKQAITMGVGTILAARRILLLAFGEAKARVVRQAAEGEISSAIAASFLQEHPNVEFILDAAAAGELSQHKTPWLLDADQRNALEWDARTVRRAVLWLSQRVEKPILKLVAEDYNDHGLRELVNNRGSAYELNIEVFQAMQRTITGWPAGKPGRARADGSADVCPKRVVVFSPHPDDDVISMGGTLIRLCDQKHEVHVAYQTSGNIAVWDDEALRHVDFLAEIAQAFGLRAADQVEHLVLGVQEFIGHKAPAALDTPALQTIKSLIRRTEARAAARYSGVLPEHIHFLDLPFYETGRVKKKPLSQADIDLTAALLRNVRPHQIYAAGDLSDPHGTHRVCLAAVERALHALRDEPWLRGCELLHYRGAWQEWEPHEIDLAVPLAPGEVERKRMAIFKHESQKDKALFPGPSDAREFWKRAEDRNRETARQYDRLGLAEYEAIEAFVRRPLDGGEGSRDAVLRLAPRE